MSAQPAPARDIFAAAREQYASLERFLVSDEAQDKTHSELERELEKKGMELLRQLYQAHLDLRGPGEAGGPVRGSDDIERDDVRLHERGLETIFGEVKVERAGYGAPGVGSLHPLDAELNLSPELYSHELRRRVAQAAAEGSFDQVVAELSERGGGQVGKRQAEELASRAAQDFDAFYKQRTGTAVEPGSFLVISVDGKGVVVRPEDLRAKTRRKAKRRDPKRQKRLSPGEKRNAKRMATVATVYSIAPQVRAAEQVIRAPGPKLVTGGKPPRASQKRVWASLEKTSEQVITEAVEEALRRDPEGARQPWVVLVDGLEHQLKLLHQVFGGRSLAPTIVLDFVHVMEYVWKAGMALFGVDHPAVESWVGEQLLGILGGRSDSIAAGIRDQVTGRRLSAEKRKTVNRCANYLLKNAAYLRYREYLGQGLPIASGVIEGACRFLVKDRLEVTGARWSLAGAESVLRLRALKASGDFDEYWRFHEEQEFKRHHSARYAEGQVVPTLNPKWPRPKRIK